MLVSAAKHEFFCEEFSVFLYSEVQCFSFTSTCVFKCVQCGHPTIPMVLYFCTFTKLAPPNIVGLMSMEFSCNISLVIFPVKIIWTVSSCVLVLAVFIILNILSTHAARV